MWRFIVGLSENSKFSKISEYSKSVRSLPKFGSQIQIGSEFKFGTEFEFVTDSNSNLDLDSVTINMRMKKCIIIKKNIILNINNYLIIQKKNKINDERYQHWFIS